MTYYPMTLREKIRRLAARAFFGTDVLDSEVIRELEAHERRMRTDPLLLKQRATERVEANKTHRAAFVVAILNNVVCFTMLSWLALTLTNLPTTKVLASAAAGFVAASLLFKRLILPATPPWAFWGRYAAYDSPSADRPAIVAPWRWLLNLAISGWSANRDFCRVVDVATADVVDEWARATKAGPPTAL